MTSLLNTQNEIQYDRVIREETRLFIVILKLKINSDYGNG